MKLLFAGVFIFLTMGKVVVAQNWYVSGHGDDGNDGRSEAKAFRTLQKAADVVQAGQTVLIGDGVYTNADRNSGSAVLLIRTSGRPDAWITWKAMPGQHPEVRPKGWAGITVSGSYQVLDGLMVTGANDSIYLLQAQEDAKKATPDPLFNTNGIFVNGRGRKPEEKPHHVIIRHCTVSKCPGGGIAAIESDYITIEDNKVFENAWFMRYGGSGISTLDNWAFDDAPGYHIIIRRNYVWNNRTMVAWEKIGRLSDGNGIILDVTDQDVVGATNPNGDAVVKVVGSGAVAGNGALAGGASDSAAAVKPRRPEWKGRALVADNLSAYNGGSGIHTFRTKYVDIINNTTYQNGQIVGYPELFANSCEDIVFLNNIVVPRPAGKVTSNNKNSRIRWDYNLYPKPQSFFTAEHDIVADPLFIDVELVPVKGDFRLARGSRGRDSGTSELVQATDVDGHSRPKGQGIDRGAFEQ